MLKLDLVGFDMWLRQRKPLFSTALFKSADLCPPGFLQTAKPDSGKSAPSAPGSVVQLRTQPLNEVPSAPGAAQTTHAPVKKPGGGSRQIPIGKRYERGNLGSLEALPGPIC